MDNLLDSARLATGGVEPQLRAVGYDEILAPALATVDAGHLVAVEVDDTTPAVLADPGLLERVIANLTANALTHGRARAVVARAAARGDQVELRIVDHGPGLPASRAESMFAPFQRRGDRTTPAVSAWASRWPAGSPKRWAAPCAPSTPPAGASPW